MFMTGQTTAAAVEAVAKTWNASGQNNEDNEDNDDSNDDNEKNTEKNNEENKPTVVTLFSFHWIPQKPSSVRMQFVYSIPFKNWWQP